MMCGPDSVAVETQSADVPRRLTPKCILVPLVAGVAGALVALYAVGQFGKRGR